MNKKFITVGDIRSAIKDLDDFTSVYIDNDMVKYLDVIEKTEVINIHGWDGYQNVVESLEVNYPVLILKRDKKL